MPQADQSITVTQFHFTKWPNDEKAANTTALLKLIKELVTVQHNTGNNPITVMCKLVYLYTMYCIASYLGEPEWATD